MKSELSIFDEQVISIPEEIKDVSVWGKVKITQNEFEREGTREGRGTTTKFLQKRQNHSLVTD